MKKFAALLLTCFAVHAADVKISELDAITAPSAASVIPLVDSAASPLTRKYLLTNLVTQSQIDTSAEVQAILGSVYQATNATTTRLAGIGAGTSGDVLYRDAAGWTNLAKGSDGKVLKLTSGFPAWETDDTGGTGVSGTMINAGASTAAQYAKYTDTTGTNLAPDTITLASADFANQGTTTTVLHGNASGNPSWSAVVEADMSTSDVTTLDVSTTKHGFAPKAPNDTTKFLRGDATWAVPSGSSDNWVASGTTNSTLAGVASVHDLVVTNSMTVDTLTATTVEATTYNINDLTATNSVKVNSLTADMAALVGADKTLTNSATVSKTELEYLNGVTSGIQTQLDAKAPIASPAFTTKVTVPDGSVTVPSVGFTSDDDGTGTGIYRSAANVPSIAANGQEAARFGFSESRFSGDILVGSTTSQTSYISRENSYIMRFGGSTVTPGSLTLKPYDIASGTNLEGHALKLLSGKGRGTGNGGAVVIETDQPLTGSGTTVHTTSSVRYYASGKVTTLTESSATTIATIAIAADEFAGAVLNCTVFAADASDRQSLTSSVIVDAVNKAGTVTASTPTVTGSTAAVSAGTLTCTYTAAASGNNVIIQANAVSSLTQTTLNCRIVVVSLSGNGTCTVTP